MVSVLLDVLRKLTRVGRVEEVFEIRSTFWSKIEIFSKKLRISKKKSKFLLKIQISVKKSKRFAIAG